MIRALTLLLAASSLAACAAGGPEVGPPIIAPTLGQPSEAMVLRRCDDGGDGGVLIDGICL